MCTIVTLCNYEWFEDWADERVKKRGHDYEALKENIGKKAWQQTCKIFPQLEHRVFLFDLFNYFIVKHI